MEHDTPPATPVGLKGVMAPDFGMCYTGLWEDAGQAPSLSILPRLGEVVDELEDDFGEFGGWQSYLPEWSEQKENHLPDFAASRLVDTVEKPGLGVVAIHVSDKGRTRFDEVAMSVSERCLVGTIIQDIVDKGVDLTGEAEQFAWKAALETTRFNTDAAENYARLGDLMEDVHSRGGFSEISRSAFTTMIRHLAMKWTSAREATAAARLAASLVYNKEDEPWSPQIFEEAMEVDEDEQSKQERLLRMAGLVFHHQVHRRLEERDRRRHFAAWRADATAPAKAFCRAVGIDERRVDLAVDRAVSKGVPLLKWAAGSLAASGLTAVKTMALVASGAAVTATMVAAAGLVLDWYYEDVQDQKLGPARMSHSDPSVYFDAVARAKNYFAVGAAVSDETYDVSNHTQVVRIDPFFFSARTDIARLKDDTAAQRSLTNALIQPLLQNISTGNKTVVNMPATVSEESARHLQEAMPEFYFRIVNRSHSHAELWAARRGFEMIVSRQLAQADYVHNVVMIGGNTRQTSKIPNVVVNYGPKMTGRDDARHVTVGTNQQRALFERLTLDERFGDRPQKFQNAAAVAFYSAQDIDKRDFFKAMIESNIRRAFVALNIPVIMMDERITMWDDRVLNARYVRRGDKLSMTPLHVPTAGYVNDYAKVMSWVRPIKPIRGYDCTMSTLTQVSSSYLFEVSIGAGRQEEHEVVWRMPDAGHYVLHDLTRDSNDVKYYTVPAGKFDTVVKFVVQLSGAKNVLEATAGRILGLEAQIRIGGTVLERSWDQDHRQFVSTMIHAIICSGLDKADAMLMLGKLKKHFSDRQQKTLIEKVVSGYAKLFGWQSDLRLPGKADRGSSDYDVVTHWTSIQIGGSGTGVFDDESTSTRKRPQEAEGGEGDREKKVKFAASEEDVVIDEGYHSKSDLDESDAEEHDLGEAADDKTVTIVDRMTKWLVGKDKHKESTSLPEFKPDSATQNLVVPLDTISDMTTDSAFDPEGPILFSQSTGSKANVAFSQMFFSNDDVLTAIVGHKEFPAPDKGSTEVVRLCLEQESRDVSNPITLYRPMVGGAAPKNPLEELEMSFFSEVGAEDQIRAPSVLIDGIAGAAKSSCLRTFIKHYRKNAVVVCPTNSLAREWRKNKCGTVVTRHKLSLANMRNREILVIDEVFAYTKTELYAYLWKARATGLKVVLLGDRRQQYEDGSEITISDLQFLGLPTVRFTVSNTMPVDAVMVARWAADADPHSELFQTRNKRVHSIYFKQKDQREDGENIKARTTADNWLTVKDRLAVPLNYQNITDEDCGFAAGKEDEWLSVSRTQGMRASNVQLLCGAHSRVEKWFAKQPGLFYVACSRHSSTLIIYCDQYDLHLLTGLKFETHGIVAGRLAVLAEREKFDAPILLLSSQIPKESPVTAELVKRGHAPQTLKFKAMGQIREDWRPWHKFTAGNPEVARTVFAAVTDRLIGEQTPYVQTEAVKLPVYQAAMGLKSLRRPEVREPETLSTTFSGLSRLAVLQNSKDELLDQKNVIERTARPRIIDEGEFRVRVQASELYALFKEAYLRNDGELALSTFTGATDWADTRTADFAAKLSAADLYGITAFSTRSMGFLKTQTKVKLKREFAMEENYGQTVLASPADFNAKFGPYSKMVMRNARLLCRPGVIMDSGYSDKEVARAFRNSGVLPKFELENYQADVKRQDTSHTPVTLAVFCLFLEDLGMPKELVELYRKHSGHFEYNSMKAGLYRGEAAYNLGSGDPFTLFRNIVEVMTVMVERFGGQMASMNMIIKGDDFLSDKIPTPLPVRVQEVRDTQLTEDFNKPPYHAGRFFIGDDVVPDPVRMVAKILVKKSHDVERVKQLAESFYDRYVPLTDYTYNKMLHYVTEAYSDFEPEFAAGALDLYHALRDRNLFFSLLTDEIVPEEDKLVVVDATERCANYAVSWFSGSPDLQKLVESEDRDTVEYHLNKNHIPNYRVRGKPNDFLKRGVWLTENHAWAVVGLTEYKEREEKENSPIDDYQNKSTRRKQTGNSSATTDVANTTRGDREDQFAGNTW